MNIRNIHYRGRRVGAVAPAIAVGLSLAASIASAQTMLPDINVIAPTPLSGTRTTKPRSAHAAPGPRSGARTSAPAAAPATAAPVASAPDPALIDRDKVPSNTSVVTSADFNHGTTPTFLDAVNRALPGVFLGDQTGNPFQRDVEFRGFTASPVQGTPQGIAVYQNGVRVNESWGDVVNWDFIPEKAIDRMALFPSNPVFGLNAIGGALSIQMKNGFSYQGAELEVMGGSNGRIQSSIQAGRQDGNYSAYALFESGYDKGWRDFASSSHINRMYTDVGARNDTTEFHINFTGANNILASVAATPIQLLNQGWSKVYTWPQTTNLQLAFLNASLAHNFSDTLAFQGNVYYRGFWQSHVDGNGTDAFPCSRSGGDGHGYLCIGDGDPIFGDDPVRNTLSRNAYLGEIDRNQTATNSFGGTAQLTSADKVFGRDNHFVVGASLDHGMTHFTGTSELGTVDPNTLFVNGTGVFIDQPDAGFSPVDVNAKNTYTGIYATDTFDVTNRLSVTAGGRFNLAQITLQDQTGINPDLNSNNTFQRFNPVIGATYKLLPDVTAYAGYSEANRAPTPLELGCSNPQKPCMIDNFLVSDPPLKQVVSHTVEAGLRGSFGKDAKTGQLTWGVGYFRTLSDDDIVNVVSDIGTNNLGFFTNAGKTLRQGFEAKLNYRDNRWNVYANYTFVDATFRSTETLSSPNNPAAQCAGGGDDDDCAAFVTTRPGDHIPGIPAHRFKIGAEYAVTDAWKIGADLNVVGSQYLVGDYTNQNPKVPAYAVLNLHTSYQLTPNVELFGMINNALNQHYYVTGTFYEPGGFTSASNKAPLLGSLLDGSDNRTLLPGMPLAVYAGLKAKF